jgi:hypothetical protein
VKGVRFGLDVEGQPGQPVPTRLAVDHELKLRDLRVKTHRQDAERVILKGNLFDVKLLQRKIIIVGMGDFVGVTTAEQQGNARGHDNSHPPPHAVSNP